MSVDIEFLNSLDLDANTCSTELLAMEECLGKHFVEQRLNSRPVEKPQTTTVGIISHVNVAMSALIQHKSFNEKQ